MTELELLQRAKLYMEKLANGINPINGTKVPEDEIINNVRLSRCFFYVADVLQQVIEYGGIPSQQKLEKISFFLPMEKWIVFECSDKPISILEVSQRINTLITRENMEPIRYSTIRDWLFSLDMLEEVWTDSKKKMIRPTQRGEKLGIMLKKDVGFNISSSIVLYNSAAQHFIFDNLNAIVDFKNNKIEHHRKPWIREQDAILTDLYQQGISIDEISIALNRNRNDILQRLKKLYLL